MPKKKKQVSAEFIEKIILDLFIDWEKCRPALLYTFLESAVGFNRTKCRYRGFNLVDKGKLHWDIERNFVRIFKPKIKEKNQISLYVDSKIICQRMEENNGFLSEKDLQNLKQDTYLGRETRRLVWYLVRVEKVVITWDGKLALVKRRGGG